MAVTKLKNYVDVTGGISKKDPQAIADNEFTSLKNFKYDEELKLVTRRGYAAFGSAMSDTVVLLDDCEDITDWAVSGDASTLTLDTTNPLRGAGSLNFDISAYSTGTSKLTLTAGATVDMSTSASIGFRVKFPTDYNSANYTDTKARIGSSASDYYEWTITDPTANESTFIYVDITDATTTGTPDMAAVDFFELEITTVAGYAGYTDWIVDSIKGYSSTSDKPITSGHYWRNSVNLKTNLIAVCGSGLFLYDETTTHWEEIDSGLTELETATDIAGNVTRWDFMTFGSDANGNDVVYMLNGVDNYRSWNGVAITDHGAVMGRYVRNVNTFLAITGDDAAPNAVKRSAANPADATPARFSSTTIIGKYDEGRINAINEISLFAILYKDSKSYSLDISNGATIPIDSQNGGFSNRAIANVENGVLYYTGSGIDFLEQKEGSIGGAALISSQFTSHLSEYFADIKPGRKNANFSTYMTEVHNYLFTFDSNDDDIPDKTLVYSSLTGTWSEYVLPLSYHFTRYVTSSGIKKYLLCGANSGNMYEIESGFSDNDTEYECRIETKEYDFGDITLSKYFESIDIVGLKSLGTPIEVEVWIDGSLVKSGQITDEMLDKTSSPHTVGSSPTGLLPLTGTGIETETSSLTMHPYVARAAVGKTGRKVQIKMYTNATNLMWSLGRIRLAYDEQTIDIFPSANIL